VEFFPYCGMSSLLVVCVKGAAAVGLLLGPATDEESDLSHVEL
jgi:hypothetical protein